MTAWSISRAARWISPCATLSDASAPAGAVRLFGERLLPVASPSLIRRKSSPLARPADLAHHVLIHLDDSHGLMPWLNWPAWLAGNGLPELKPAGSLRFSFYDQVIQAALGGQGVALGRIPLIGEFLADGRLVGPFPKRYDSPRSYFAIVAPHAVQRPDVAAFVSWLVQEATASAAAKLDARFCGARASRSLAHNAG